MYIEGTYLNIKKTIYDKLTENIFNDEKLKAFSLRSGTRGATLTTVDSAYSEVLVIAIREEKERK